jgi:hypothetical protein
VLLVDERVGVDLLVDRVREAHETDECRRICGWLHIRERRNERVSCSGPLLSAHAARLVDDELDHDGDARDLGLRLGASLRVRAGVDRLEAPW